MNSTLDYILRGILYTELSCLALRVGRACSFCFVLRSLYSTFLGSSNLAAMTGEDRQYATGVSVVLAKLVQLIRTSRLQGLEE